MPVITLLSDFGLSDNYVGIMKGVILAICPSATIIDITHQIPPQDISAAAYSILTAYRYFPHHTIHVAVVDPGVGSMRRIVAIRTGRGIFIAPDNGLLGPVLDRENAEEAVVVETSTYFLHPVSRTFHGRDILAPVAAHLASGVELGWLGPSIPPQEMVRLNIKAPEIGADGTLTGTIIAVDRFGNLITNIGTEELRAVFGHPEIKRIAVVLKGDRIEGLSETYASAERDKPLALIGGSGLLEVSINLGNAGERFNAGTGDRIKVYKLT